MENNFPKPERVLVITAHPDDPEFGAAGTVAYWAKQGAKVTFVIVTDGSKGSADPHMTRENLVNIRKEEECRAADILGVSEVIFLGYEDGTIQNTQALRRDIVRQIRIHKPDILITHDPTARIIDNNRLNHTDHRAVGDTTLDAVFPLARDRLNFPEHEEEGLEPHKVLDIFLLFTDEPNLVVDITNTIDLKIAALQAHQSQIGDPVALAERIQERCHRIAYGTSFMYGESFRRVVLGG